MSNHTDLSNTELKEILENLKLNGHLNAENVTVDEGSWWSSEERETVDLSIKNRHHRPAQIDLATKGILPAGVNALTIGAFVEQAENQLDSTPEGREILGELSSPTGPDASSSGQNRGRE